MNIQTNVQLVKNFFAAIGSGDTAAAQALASEHIEWIIPGKDWPLAGTYRGHQGLTGLLRKADEAMETSFPRPPEFVAQGDRVLMIGVATGAVKRTGKSFEDHWVFDITIADGMLSRIREYVDTQTLAVASRVAENPNA